MSTCLLCLTESSDDENLELSQNICRNFTFKDAIKDYFKCSKLILSSNLKTICRLCCRRLTEFHQFVAKIDEYYWNDAGFVDLTQNGSKKLQILDENEGLVDCCEEIDDMIEYDVTGSVELLDDEEIMNQNEYLSRKDESFDILEKNCLFIKKSEQISINKPQILMKNAKKTSLNDSLARNLATWVKISEIKPKNPQKCQNLPQVNLKRLPIDAAILNSIKVSQVPAEYPLKFQNNPQISQKGHQQSSQNCPLDKSPKNTSNSRNHHQDMQKSKMSSKTFKNHQSLQIHSQKSHSPLTLKCQHCDKVYSNKYILKTHLRKHIVDSDRHFECYKCKKPAKNLPHLLDHFKYKHDAAYAKYSVCHVCSKVVTRLDIHLRQIHPTEPVERVKCDICGHWMKKTSLKGHLLGHADTNGCSCDVCGKLMKNKNSLLCHLKRIHSEGKFKCEYCDKSFHQPNRLVDHVACQHTGNFIYRCRVETCSKMFRNSGRRRIHERRMHPNEYDRSLKASYLRENLEADLVGES